MDISISDTVAYMYVRIECMVSSLEVSISEWVPARELRANTRPGLDTHSTRARHELDPDSTRTRPAHDARVLATLAVICTVSLFYVLMLLG